MLKCFQISKVINLLRHCRVVFTYLNRFKGASFHCNFLKLIANELFNACLLQCETDSQSQFMHKYHIGANI